MLRGVRFGDLRRVPYGDNLGRRIKVVLLQIKAMKEAETAPVPGRVAGG